MIFNLLWVFENLVKILAVVIGSDDKAAAVGPEKYFSKSFFGVSLIAILVILFLVILNKIPFSTVEMFYGTQVLWPNHCIQGSIGAEFHPKLVTKNADLIIRKGFRPEIDSYSAFFDNDHETPTGLYGYLQSRGVDTIYLCGLALDFCVYFSAIDGIKLDFKVNVIKDACRAIDLEGSLDKSLNDMKNKGVNLICSGDL